MNNILDEQRRSVAIPKRITSLVRDIWQLQLRLSRRQGEHAHNLMEHQKFRVAYDLLSLGAEIERQPELQRLSKWWEEFQIAAMSHQQAILRTLDDSLTPHRHSRRHKSNVPRRERAS
ncbi:MAG: hypothetical protein ACR5K7_03980 [Symbiopectobacterium sp.]